MPLGHERFAKAESSILLLRADSCFQRFHTARVKLRHRADLTILEHIPILLLLPCSSLGHRCLTSWIGTGCSAARAERRRRLCGPLEAAAKRKRLSRSAGHGVHCSFHRDAGLAAAARPAARRLVGGSRQHAIKPMPSGAVGAGRLREGEWRAIPDGSALAVRSFRLAAESRPAGHGVGRSFSRPRPTTAIAVLDRRRICRNHLADITLDNSTFFQRVSEEKRKTHRVECRVVSADLGWRSPHRSSQASAT
jgi:hypothetical protein